MKKKPLIVFDMDGVIIDVSRSYRDTVRQTARLFFKWARSWKALPDPLFPLSDLAMVKQSGGLNNDWDLACLTLNLLFSLIKKPQIHEDTDPWLRHKETICCCDVTELAQFLKSTEKPLTTLFRQKGKPDHEFIRNLYTGDVGSGNIIKQIFQEIYLGRDLFKSTYSIPVRVYDGEGYINREKLLVKKASLESLSKNNILAIATGRPKAEADYPLNLFGLKKYFQIILSLDDCIIEERSVLEQLGEKVSLSKPNPYMLDAIAEIKKGEASRFYYVGDMPDDMEAASRSGAGYIGVGALYSTSDSGLLKKELLQAGAKYIIEDFEELNGIRDQDA
jgi:phosphoglycolate phosphatase-like HAD superfamily hydrolase